MSTKIPCMFCGNDIQNIINPGYTHNKYCSHNCKNKMAKLRKSLKSNGIPVIGRWIIMMRDNFSCIYCGSTAYKHGALLQIDHIKPRHRGGEDVLSNLVTSCEGCNLEKSHKLLPDMLYKDILNEVKSRNKEWQFPDDYRIYDTVNVRHKVNNASVDRIANGILKSLIELDVKL